MAQVRVWCFAGQVARKSLRAKSLLTVCARSTGSSAGGAAKDREPLRKARTPQGRLDDPAKEGHKDVLEQPLTIIYPFTQLGNFTGAIQGFPDDVNPGTKEKGGPRGPEPTRYGDWERKGRCIDF